MDDPSEIHKAVSKVLLINQVQSTQVETYFIPVDFKIRNTDLILHKSDAPFLNVNLLLYNAIVVFTSTKKSQYLISRV